MYKDPILSRYLDLIRNNRSDIKTFKVGDPLEINLDTTQLPAVFISFDRQEFSEETNMTDSHRVSITISVVTDVRSSWEGAGSAVVDAINKLTEIVVGRDNDYTLNDKSIMYLLRNNVNMGLSLYTDVGSATVADFGVATRPPEEFAIQANLSLIAYFSQQR